MLNYLSNVLFATFLVIIGIMSYAIPVLLGVIWFRRLKAPRRGDLRDTFGWVGIASLGCTFFFIDIFYSPNGGSPAFEPWFYRWFKICTSISVLAFITSLIGTGKMQWAIRTSAIVTPLSCLLQKILE